MNEELYIKRCIELAEKAKGHVAPNPMVGAVLVHQGRMIGEGWHQNYGEAHAEVNCIESVTEDDRGLIPESTMYVSLEPCAHYGKTPPCAERILREGIKKVVLCNEDPFEKVDGKGVELLQAGGVAVTRQVLDKEGKWLSRRFFTFHSRKRPYIILKWAQTEQGFFAPLDRSRLQLTGEHSRRLVHQWRTQEAAILVGFNTALNDNPQLTARECAGRQPLRIVLDRALKLPASHNVYNNETPTWIINEVKEEQAGHVRFVKLSSGEGLIPSVLDALYRDNVQSIIIEGGIQVLQSFIEKGLWDEARVFTADADLAAGLPAPLLTDAKLIFNTNLLTDRLAVYLHRSNPYHYVPGMSL